MIMNRSVLENEYWEFFQTTNNEAIVPDVPAAVHCTHQTFVAVTQQIGRLHICTVPSVSIHFMFLEMSVPDVYREGKESTIDYVDYVQT
jgi:hypothetical protein